MNQKNTETRPLPWLNPVGGLGDVLMYSSVLKMAHDQRGFRCNLIRRARYAEMLAGHPAIAEIDFFPKGAERLSTAYWERAEFNSGEIPRAFQMLGKMFGLALPVPENFYLPLDGVSDKLLASLIPWGKKTAVLAPTSESPRKMLPFEKWERVAAALHEMGALVLQFGQASDRKIKHAYSLCGLSSPKEAVLLLKRADLLIAGDNFLAHAAHLTGTPAITLWGPTSAGVYGYPEHKRLSAPEGCSSGKCIMSTVARERSEVYRSPCPEKTHCLDKISSDEIIESARKLLFQPAFPAQSRG